MLQKKLRASGCGIFLLLQNSSWFDLPLESMRIA
jgi:hypothetical protein